MRSARLVGLSPDGTALIVVDDTDEQLELAVDDRLRGALRGAGPRPGLENPMTTSLSPRDIQARIRAGETLEDVTAAAGLPYERVERFAAPVLAEREHLALMAMSSSVRRRGETTGHRVLRATVAERLLKRGVDADSLDWDAFRLEDGRWAVTAAYRLADEDQRATFHFDVRGRFSVPADEPARWLAGEQPPESSSGHDARRAGDEPTVDLTDELALVRVVQEAGAATAAAAPSEPALEPPRTLRAVPTPVEEQAPAEPDATGPAEDELTEPYQPALDEPEIADTARQEPEAGADSEPPAVPGIEDPSELTALYAMLGSDGYSEDSPRVYAGLSDASAVPETAGGGWEPAIVVDYPLEPSLAEEDELPAAEHPDRQAVPMDDKSAVELSTPVEDDARTDEEPGTTDEEPAGTDEPAPPYARTEEANRAEETEEFQLEAEPPTPKPAKRKRAAVPSWDEIMFGGPKPPG